MKAENPKLLTDTDSRFPLTVSSADGKKTYLFWQETDTKARQIYLSVRTYTDLNHYSEVSELQADKVFHLR